MKKLLIFIILLTFQDPVFAVCREYLNSKKYFNNTYLGREYELWYFTGSRDINYWKDPRKYKKTDFVKCINPRFDEHDYVYSPTKKLKFIASHDAPKTYTKPLELPIYLVHCDNNRKAIMQDWDLGKFEFRSIYDKNGRQWNTFETKNDSEISRCIPIDYPPSGYLNADHYYKSARYQRHHIPKAEIYFHVLTLEKHYFKKGITPNF